MNHNFKIKVKWTWDNKTKFWVLQSKRFSISAYGKTKKECREMFDAEIDDCIMITKPK